MNPDAFVADMFDLSSFDYSLQWSSEEDALYQSLLKASPPQSPEEEQPKQHSKNYLVLKKYRTKKRQERDELKKAALELEDRLKRLHQAKELKDILHPPGKWQQLAVKERLLEQKAKLENQKLRELVQDHMMTAQILANVLEKTREQTKAMTFLYADDEKWKRLILVCDPVLRTSAMHQMLDREYEITDSSLVEAGLIDVSGEVQRHVSKYLHNGTLEFQTVVYSRAYIPIDSVIESVWKVMQGTAVGVPSLNRRSKEVFVVDTNTVYVDGWLTHPLGNFQRRVLCKKYINAAHKGTIVCRSIEDDELMPYNNEPPFSREVSWLTVEVNNNGWTDLKFFEKFRPSHWSETNIPTSHWIKAFEEGSQLMRDAVKGYIYNQGQVETHQL
ncbi:hypothetical protein THRCLA_10477 [Thraustotheca clavata]|uniref:Uncharacterized protein n=1 Tax=Thraustotheca clavata TaxID=74557 RepID=A0A1V9YNJ3_9STRA|nr:hypothetical protein THRCLA_10477 [Thraustotheca clavata]